MSGKALLSSYLRRGVSRVGATRGALGGAPVRCMYEYSRVPWGYLRGYVCNLLRKVSNYIYADVPAGRLGPDERENLDQELLNVYRGKCILCSSELQYSGLCIASASQRSTFSLSPQSLQPPLPSGQAKGQSFQLLVLARDPSHLSCSFPPSDSPAPTNVPYVSCNQAIR